MLYALIFLNLTIFERILNLNIGFMSIGIGDIFIILFLFFNIFGSKKLNIDKGIFIIAILFFVSIFASLIFNSSYYGLNSLFTVPAKIMVGAIIATHMLSSELNRKHILLLDINILIFIFIEIFLSDASPFFSFEFFNRNETLAYISCLFCLRSTCIYIGKIGDFNFLKNVFIPFLIIFSCAIIVQSRQASLAALVFIATYYLASSINKKLLVRRGILTLGLFGILLSFFSTIEVSGYAGSRIQTLQTLEPSNRADQQRLANIIQSYEGFKESPIIGNGPTSFIRNNPFNKVAHNTFASTLYELGMVGLIVLFMLFKKLLITANIKTYDERSRLFSKLIASFALFLIFQSLFIEALPKAPLYIILSCCICFTKRVKFNKALSQTQN